MTQQRVDLSPERVTVRLVQIVPAGTAGSTVSLGGLSWAGSFAGLNGPGGLQEGSFTRMLGDASGFSITFPNGAGSDGISHRDRFRITSDSSYVPGDEWLEVYRNESELLFVGTPTKAKVTLSSVVLSGFDAAFLLKKTRETQAGYWVAAPRDVFEHYTRAWQVGQAADYTAAGPSYPAGGIIQTTSDGKWAYSGGSPGVSTDQVNWPGRLRLPYVSVQASVWSAVGLPFGRGAADPRRPWVVEVGFRVPTDATVASTAVLLQLNTAAGGGTTLFDVTIFNNSATAQSASSGGLTSVSAAVATGFGLVSGGLHTATIERRDRWVFAYVDGQLIGVFPDLSGLNSAPANLYPLFGYEGSGSGNYCDLDYFVIRQAPWTLNVGSVPGDYQIPAPPSTGGLVGEYYNDADLWATDGLLSSVGATRYSVLNPTRSGGTGGGTGTGLVQRRLDAVVVFASTNPPAWQPAVAAPDGNYFSVRWVGAIYLPLASQDVNVKLNPVDDYGRVWVGRTRFGEQVVTNWTGDTAVNPSTAGLRSTLGSVSGWYPIVVEYAQLTGAGGIGLQYDVGTPGTFVNVPANVLAPVGVYENAVRGDSHYDALRAVADAFALSWSTTPKQLESGSFPGEIAPYIRVGRDTEYVFDEPEGIDLSDEIDAEDRALQVLADASGIGGDGSGQLTAGFALWDALGTHAMLAQEFESLPQTTIPEVLAAQLATLYALRSSPWEQVSGTPRGRRQAVDSFPVSGVLAEFDWGPGDGVRLNWPTVGVVDASPRQVLQVDRDFHPEGLSAPRVGFRQRPRDPISTLRKLFRAATVDRRQYQGQLVVQAGSGGVSGVYSEAALPADISRVRRATLIVLSKGDTTTSWTVSINGTTTSLAITRTGRYDVSGYVGRNGGTEPRMIATLGSPTAAGDEVAFILELVVLV